MVHFSLVIVQYKKYTLNFISKNKWY